MHSPPENIDSLDCPLFFLSNICTRLPCWVREKAGREKGDCKMDVRVGDILVMKKEHPCGEKRWLVMRSGMDFRLKCVGCGHEVLIPRSKAEKNIRQILRDGESV